MLRLVFNKNTTYNDTLRIYVIQPLIKPYKKKLQKFRRFGKSLNWKFIVFNTLRYFMIASTTNQEAKKNFTTTISKKKLWKTVLCIFPRKIVIIFLSPAWPSWKMLRWDKIDFCDNKKNYAVKIVAGVVGGKEKKLSWIIRVREWNNE